MTDPDGDILTLQVETITQDEDVMELGSGSTCPDGIILEDGKAALRSERSGIGDGRAYHIGFSADDGRGGTCTGEVILCCEADTNFCVPHDQGQGSSTCTDQGTLFDSTVCSE